MNGREFWVLRDVSDEKLEEGLGRLLGAGARVEARVVAHLAEVDARRLHLILGCSSLYDYCRKRLGLSDYEAFARIATARMAAKYPVVFEMLERRELHLTAICEVREFLTAENHRELLAEVSGKTKLQIREVLARRFPHGDVPTSLKKLPALEPLSPGRYRLLMTLSAEQKEKLELARDLLSHVNASGDFTVVFERALDELILRLQKRRFGQRVVAAAVEPARLGHIEPIQAIEPIETIDPIEPTDALESIRKEERQRRHIGHETRRQISKRDGCRCAFVGREGRRCEERAFLQFHHRRAWAWGGSDNVDNLQLLCREHNRLLAERDFGRAHVEQVIDAERASEQP